MEFSNIFSIFSLILPKPIPVREEMSDESFNAMMSVGYAQALRDESQPIDEAFKELE